MEVVEAPAVVDDDPLAVAAEGSAPRPNQWPPVTSPTPEAKMVASGGNGLPLRERLLAEGRVRFKDGLEPGFAALIAAE